jgi:hypothetical protein
MCRHYKKESKKKKLFSFSIKSPKLLVGSDHNYFEIKLWLKKYDHFMYFEFAASIDKIQFKQYTLDFKSFARSQPIVLISFIDKLLKKLSI